jgi:hypothetical protein
MYMDSVSRLRKQPFLFDGLFKRQEKEKPRAPSGLNTKGRIGYPGKRLTVL